MSRLSIVNDTVSHLCWRYVKRESSVNLSIKICTSTLPVVKNDVRQAYIFIYEIAHHIGYVNSSLFDDMSERTYKVKKKKIRDVLQKILEEGSENGT